MSISSVLSRIRALAVASAAVLAFTFIPASGALPLPYSYAAEEGEETFPEEPSVDPTSKSDGYSAVLYDNSNGLPTSEANAIAETREGFIWIGSYSGLIRYDGNTFDRVDSTTGIASIVSLYTDSRNRLWVGTNDSGVAVMEDGAFRMYSKSDGLKSLSIRSITEDSDGSIYLATTHGIAYIDEDMELHNVDEPQINEEYIRVIKTGADGLIYGVTMNNAVFTLKDGKLQNFYNANRLGISDIHSVLPDPVEAGNVYITTKESEIYYGKLQKGFRNTVPINTAPLEYINSVEYINDTLWICTDKGIGIYRDGTFIQLDNLPLTTSIEGLMMDYQGNLWFASSQQGVMKIVPNQFTDIFDKYGLSPQVVYSTCRYNDMLLIGTKNDGLNVLRNGMIVSELPITSSESASGAKYGDTDLIEMLHGCKIRSIIRDSKNRIWFSTFGEQGLVRYDNGKVTKFKKINGLPSERVRTVYECADGTMLVACTGGIVKIDGDEITDVYGESAGISNTEILTVVEAPSGDIVAGTDGDGIYVVRDTDTLHIGTDDGLHSDVVMRIKRDIVRDLYWIVTSNSIAYMDSDYKVTTISNFPYSNNFDLYESTTGEMWVLSSNGIYVVPVEELLANGEIDAVFYGKDNGLPCITTSNSYSELTSGGELYISGTTGIAKVNIETPFENVSDLKISVPYIEADGKRIYPEADGSFSVSSKVRKLTIYSFVYNYSLINPQVTYHLDGFENESTTVKRSLLAPVDYTNLKGGKYDFEISIKDPQGNGNKTLSVHIVKQKAIYEMLWFRIVFLLLIIALVALAVMLYIRHRINKFRQKEREQKLLIREIVEAFAKVIDMKDKYTNGHSTRVADYTAMLTRELGYDDETVEKYYDIALLHDIGKVGVPPEVLNKPGKLTDTEFNIIKSHSALGFNTLKDISIMPELSIGAGAHHERPDGKGYPKGLKGDEIPRVAQIIAVADTFDAMYSDRPYRKRMNFDKAVSIMKEVRGTQLTSDVVDAFLRLVEKGEFRAPDDDGGGTVEDIDNIRKKLEKEQADKPQEKKEE
ncbi:MAG: two-component regulator propeller domain-containing protein [Ruminococcus sp.]|nr:two-component regulator propeller domain-containing protein [Ruminococcus sp.]